MIAIVVSKKDPAGMNIKDSLIKYFKVSTEIFDGNKVYKFNDAKLYTAEKEAIFCENIDKEISSDLFVFATKHESASKINSLSVHSPGNWSRAELGGRNKKLCVAPASYLKEALIKLNNLNNIRYDVIQECTHHGPFLEKSCMFIEIGSDEEAWENKKAADIIAKTIIYLIKNKPREYKVAFGIGGLHHTPNFKKIILNSDIAIGHICPKYALQNLNEEMIRQAMEKSKSEFVIFDWKGLGEHKQRIVEMLNKSGIIYKRTKDY